MRNVSIKYKKVKNWFGYRLHLTVDTTYELPVGFKAIPASNAESPVTHEVLDETNEMHPKIMEDCSCLLGNRG